jgi:hypothetical protein
MIRVLLLDRNKDGVLLMNVWENIIFGDYPIVKFPYHKRQVNKSGFLPLKDHCKVFPYFKGFDINKI